jgi:hypothetical protein
MVHLTHWQAIITHYLKMLVIAGHGHGQTHEFFGIIASKNKIKVLVGTESISKYNRGFGSSRSNFFSNGPNYRILNNGVSGIINYGFAGHSAIFSYLSRLEYSFDEKYYFTATLRRDGSSVFAEQSRYGFFPSFAGAWRISQEK